MRTKFGDTTCGCFDVGGHCCQILTGATKNLGASLTGSALQDHNTCLHAAQQR